MNINFEDYERMIDETVKYYKTHPRGIIPGTEACLYKEGDKECAVGRCMTKKAQKSFEHTETPIHTLLEEQELGMYEFEKKYFKKKYQLDFPIQFWKDLQKLHDKSHYWNNEQLSGISGQTLSERGQNQVEILKEYWRVEIRMKP